MATNQSQRKNQNLDEKNQINQNRKNALHKILLIISRPKTPIPIQILTIQNQNRNKMEIERDHSPMDRNADQDDRQKIYRHGSEITFHLL